MYNSVVSVKGIDDMNRTLDVICKQRKYYNKVDEFRSSQLYGMYVYGVMVYTTCITHILSFYSIPNSIIVK